MQPDEIIEHGAFNLAFTHPGAISYFNDSLPAEYVGAIHGQTGLSQFYLALLDFYRKTGLDPIDPIAFKSWLETETDIYLALGGSAGVTVFIDMMLAVDPPSPESVVALLKFRANKRQQLDSLQELQLLVSKKEHKDEGDLQRISYLTDQIRNLESEIGYDPLAGVTTATDIGKRAQSLWGLPDFIPTPFQSLNRALGYTDRGGVCKGAVHAVLAASGMGKSTFVKCLMNYWVEGDPLMGLAPQTVLYINYEEAVQHWERILFTQVTKQNVYAAEKLSADQKDFYTKTFEEKMEEWGSRFIVKHDPDTPYFDDLEKWLRDIMGHNERVPDAIIIDTIQSLFMKGAGGKPRWGQYEEMMVRFEKLAKDMHSAIIITAQENTNRMKERREVVQQSDAGGSISIVQKCAVTIHITPKKLLSDDEAEDDYVMQLQIPKNRITGDSFRNDPPLVRYNDSTKSYEPHDLPADESRFVSFEEFLS